MKSFDETRSDFLPYGFACERWNPVQMRRPDRHNEIELNLIVAGSLTYVYGGNRITIPTSTLAVFWAAVPHQIVAFDGTSPYFVATIALAEFLKIGLEQSIVHRILTGELLLESVAHELDEQRFSQWEKDLRSSDTAPRKAASLEMQARLIRLAGKVIGKPMVRGETELTRADQIACFIAKNYQQPLSTESIAMAHSLHPNYAMNIFKRAFGTTMTSFINQHRISHAQRMLVTTNESILNISIDCGFQSLSRFNEVFRSICGCSPRDYRKTHSF